jgi:hypothetical protein
VKSECDELSQASKQLQANLDSILLEREHALGEHFFEAFFLSPVIIRAEG